MRLSVVLILSLFLNRTFAGAVLTASAEPADEVQKIKTELDLSEYQRSFLKNSIRIKEAEISDFKQNPRASASPRHMNHLELELAGMMAEKADLDQKIDRIAKDLSQKTKQIN